jgi:hypothetical protein
VQWTQTQLTSGYSRFREAAGYRTRIRYDGNDLSAAWASFLGRVPWKVMVTLTFDPKRVFPVDQSRASREAWDWCTKLGWMLRRRIAWLYATERGRTGQWHAHALVADASVKDLEAALAIWKLRNGTTHARKVSAGFVAVLYVTKSARYGTEVVLSDEIVLYRDRLNQDILVRLEVAPRDDGRSRPGGRVSRSASQK